MLKFRIHWFFVNLNILFFIKGIPSVNATPAGLSGNFNGLLSNLRLSKNIPVMLNWNICVSVNLANGTRGVVVDIISFPVHLEQSFSSISPVGGSVNDVELNEVIRHVSVLRYTLLYL